MAVLVVGAVLASAVPAGAGGIPQGRYAIGDSVMRGAVQELHARRIKADTAVSRQFSALPRLIRSLRNSGVLRETVIIHLGNNGYIELADCKEAVRAATNRTIYLVTVKVPRQWRRANNRTLARCDRASTRAHLVDWFSHSVNHPGWFADDLYHLTPMGQRRYAGFISNQSR